MERFDINVGVLNNSLDYDYIHRLMLFDSMNRFEYVNSINEAKEKRDGLVLINKENIKEINKDFEHLGIILLVDEKDYYEVFNLVYDKGIIVVPNNIDDICLLEIMVTNEIRNIFSVPFSC